MSLCRAEEKVTIHFLNRDGKRISVKAATGDSLLDVVVNHDLDIDGFGKLLKNIEHSVKIFVQTNMHISFTHYKK